MIGLRSFRAGFIASTCAAALALGPAACSSDDSSPIASAHDAGKSDAGSVAIEAGAEQSIEHGTLYDYGAFLTGQTAVVRGLTITSGTQVVTTDADGKFSLVEPLNVPLNVTISGSSRSNPYATLYLPEAIFTTADGDRGDIILPDQSTFGLEEVTLGNDKSKAVVNLVVVVTGNCATAEGATITVASPSDAKLLCIDSTGYPRKAQTSVAALASQWHAAASVFDVEPGVHLDLKITHPKCKQVPFPAAYNGVVFTGNVVTKPADNANSALVLVLGDGSATVTSDGGTDAHEAKDAGASDASDAAPAPIDAGAPDAADDASDDAAID